jgi:cytochrome c peroxidase
MKRWVVLVLALVGCSKAGKTTPYAWSFLPTGVRPPIVPADNPMTDEKAALGRYLFYDVRLSGNGTTSCGTCHKQSLAFTDGLTTPKGSTGAILARNSMSLVNTAYNEHYNWSNPLLTTFEEQMLVPMFGDTPIELGMADHTDAILGLLQADPTYDALFADAFPDDKAPYTIDNVVKAIASFERTIISMNAPYDQYAAGQTSLSDAALRGLTEFQQEKLDCYHCHAPPNFAVNFISTNTASQGGEYRNDAIYNIGGNGGYPPDNPGLEQFTNVPTDEGRFHPPSLRNIMLTGPYFHDGSATTIDDAIDNYVNGGRIIASGPYAGNGSLNPNRDPLVKTFSFSDEERADLHAFFDSLTDTSVLSNPALGSPF